MNLQTFIKESLVQIAAGIADADAEVQKYGAAVNPRDVVTNKTGSGPYGFYTDDAGRIYRRPVESIQFDVVVSVKEGTATNGGLGINVGAITVGTKGRSEKESDSESRILFTVPLMMPNSKHA